MLGRMRSSFERTIPLGQQRFGVTRDLPTVACFHPARQEATASPARHPGTAIALRNKDLELKDYYRQTSKARGTWRATSATAGYSSAARRAGDRAGRRAKLGGDGELAGARSALER